MKPIRKSERYSCPKCYAEFEVEQGGEISGYCKRCETEFDEPMATRYKLLKLVEGEWYAEGVFDTPEALASAAHYLGTLGCYEQIKVETVEE